MAGLVSVNSGDIFWTPYDKLSISKRSSRWISLYKSDLCLGGFYIGAFELKYFCDLCDWRESRMSQLLD
jgi:hypothetical protein